MKRRTFLKAGGAVTVLVTGAGVWRAHDQGAIRAGQGPAYEPWIDWRDDAHSGPIGLVRAAILASNPHNTQPWLFRVTPTTIELLADRNRTLGPFDPYHREMHLGLGCALENLVLAARFEGYRPDISTAPGILERHELEDDPVLAARIDLAEATPEFSDLHAAIPRRHTNRGPYDASRTLPADVLRGLAEQGESDDELRVILLTGSRERAAFGDLILRSTDAIIADSAMVEASDRWFRHGWSEVQSHRDGVTLDAAGLTPARTAIAKMLPRPSADTNHRYWRSTTRDVHVGTAPVFGMVVVRQLYDRALTLRAGRLWQRTHLWATTLGPAMQPLNQPVEMVDRERDLGQEARTARALSEFTDGADWYPTFAFRVGYPLHEVGPSPRRSVHDVIVRAPGA